MNRTEQELRDAVFAYLEEREDMRVRWLQQDTEAFEGMVDRVVGCACREISVWNRNEYLLSGGFDA